MSKVFDPLPVQECKRSSDYIRQRLDAGSKRKWNQEAYRAYACAALSGIFNLPEFKDMLTEMAHPECDLDMFATTEKLVIDLVSEIAIRMEMEERCEVAWQEDNGH